MKQTRSDSHMEIWGARYISMTEIRTPEDRGLVVIQIEPSVRPGDYIVEVVKKEDE